MGEYTRFLEYNQSAISPEDDNFRDELLEAAASFRTFDNALDEFISGHGYTGDITDTESKIRFITEKFQDENIPLDIRGVRKWYYNHTQSEKRDIAFKFCFAFRLSVDETQEFFRRVYLQRGIDCHNIEEAVYYYCLSHRLSYSDAAEILSKAPTADNRGRIDLSSDVLFTGTIIHELDRFNSPEELLNFLNENREQFGYNNATAKKYINEMWVRISGKDGLAHKEAGLLYKNASGDEKQRSVWNIYLQIFGLMDYDDEDNSRLFVMEHDRTIQPLLKSNGLIHPVACKAFPDRQGLEKIIRGEYQSNEAVRKTIILLAFYSFWAKLEIKNNSAVYTAKKGDAGRCIASVNRLLVDSGYPALYEGNPYDWIFMFASQDTYPMDAFRSFMREVYLYKKENGEEH